MVHRYTADCENPFCFFIAEGIETKTPEEAEEIALMLHGEKRKGKFESCSREGFPGPELTIRHDFPCRCLFEDEEEDEDKNY